MGSNEPIIPHRLDGRVKIEGFLTTLVSIGLLEVHDRRIVPHVGPVASVLAQLEMILVFGGAAFEYEDKLVLATVEGSHASDVLSPDAEVLPFGVNRGPRGDQLLGMTPIHADVVDRTVLGECTEVVENGFEKGLELR